MTTRRKRFLWAAGIGTPLILSAAYLVYWFVGAHQITRTIAAWQQEQRDAGLEFDHSGIHIDGFPLYRVAIASPRFERRTAMLSWLWTSQSISVSAVPWSFRTVRGHIVGGHRLVVQNPTVTSAYLVTTEDAAFALHGGGGRNSANLRLRNVEIAGDQLARSVALAGGDVTVSADLSGGEVSDLTIEIEASGLRLLPPLFSSIDAIDQAGLRVVWTGTVPHAVTYNALAEWRDRGGTIELPRAFFKIGDASFAGEGTVALDQAMRPLAAFTARLGGFEAALDMLSAARELSPVEDAALRIALRLMAKRSRQDGSVEFPLTIQGGRVYVGRVAIGRLGPLLRKPRR